VGANNADAVAAQDGGAVITHDDLVIERLVHVLEFRHQFAGTLTRGERQVDVAHAFAAFGAFDTQTFKPAYPPFVACAPRLDAFTDPDFFLGQEFVEAYLFQSFRFQPLRHAFLPLREVAGEAEQAAAVEFDNAGCNRIQEAPIVRNDHGRPLPVAQEIFQPGN